MTEYFAWYDNHSDPTGLRPYWEGAGWVAAESATEAARKAKADGCKWTTVCVTADTERPTDETILARA